MPDGKNERVINLSVHVNNAIVSLVFSLAHPRTMASITRQAQHYAASALAATAPAATQGVTGTSSNAAVPMPPSNGPAPGAPGSVITEVQWGCLPWAGVCFPVTQVPGCLQDDPASPWSITNLANIAFGVTTPQW
jgi:hypothetical protein